MKTMNKWLQGAVGLAALTMSISAFAADDPYGTPEQAASCLQMASIRGRAHYDKSQLPAECITELDRRVELCFKDPEEQKIFKDPKYTASQDPTEFCREVVTDRVQDQMKEYDIQQAKKKQAADEQAAIDNTELPKPDQRNPTLEKAVKAAYSKGYPENKVLYVALGNWSSDYEKDAFGRVTGRDLPADVVVRQPDGRCQLHTELYLQHGHGRSFGGPLSLRGGGSSNDKWIHCEKVTARKH